MKGINVASLLHKKKRDNQWSVNFKQNVRKTKKQKASLHAFTKTSSNQLTLSLEIKKLDRNKETYVRDV